LAFPLVVIFSIPDQRRFFGQRDHAIIAIGIFNIPVLARITVAVPALSLWGA